MSESLIMQYAYNRMELNRVKKEIQQLCYRSGFPDLLSEMNEIRDRYYDYDDDCEIRPDWINWERCLQEEEIYDEPYVMLARLWDERTKLKKEGGKIKHLIYCAGVKLIKEQE